ncbi:hypothetical protein SeLEV6574_g03755 [Synchytrium endobioticum]|uniref:Piwi domain-containing protein n=1 Tax=Synchytrium endobioticum TaxID=286115 RepID=A0A507D2D1_9FUNG|nr:hypothetical protein SeLEV6574_g03755 [Synchytrium endobioticum]
MSQLPSVRAPSQQPLKAVTKGALGDGQETAIQSRPGLGAKGRQVWLYSNFYQMQFPQRVVYQYDVAITPATSKAIKRDVFEAFKDHFASELSPPSSKGVKRSVYDGEKLMFSYVKLPVHGGREFTVNVTDPDDNRVRVWTVKIQFANNVDLALLTPFLNWNGVGIQPQVPRACFQVLEVLIRHMPSLIFSPIGRNSFYLREQPGRGIKGALNADLGWFQSVRPGYKSLLLNLDQTATSFYETETVDKAIAHYFDRQDIMPTWGQLSPKQMKQVSKFLRGVKVTTIYKTLGGIQASYRIQGIDDVAAAQRRVPRQEGAEGPSLTVAQYYLQHYNIKLRFPEVPCLITGVQKKRYFPPELVRIKANQRHMGQLKPEQLAEMIKVTSTNPRDRFERIVDGQKQLHSQEITTFIRDWGVQIDSRLVQVPGRILEPPTLAIGGRTIQPREGGWMAQKFAIPAPVPLQAWSIVVIDRSTRDFERRAIERFRDMLIQQLTAKGMQVPNRNPPIVDASRSSADMRPLLLEAGKAAMNGGGKPRPDLIICIISKKNHPKYPEIKRVAETDLGVITQCIALPNLMKDRGLDKYTDNVTLKINAKLGGVNTYLDPRSDMPEFLVKQPSMFMGADVTHPPPGVGGPSIASVVGSVDRRFSIYHSVIKSQSSRLESISELSTCVMELLQSFKTRGKVYPQRVVFFRDGVSEGQFLEVMATEIRGFKQACEQLKIPHDVKLTFIVVTKRHHARMFPVNPSDGDRRNNNCLPGTTVDTGITHPFAHDYYQYGSQGLLGTSRPAHYHVLYDENGFTADMVQDMSFKSSHLYARCNRSISLASPAQYAHLVAGRARYYHEYDESASTLSDELSSWSAGEGCLSFV